MSKAICIHCEGEIINDRHFVGWWWHPSNKLIFCPGTEHTTYISAEPKPETTSPADEVTWGFELAMARAATDYFLDVVNGGRPEDKQADAKRHWHLARLGEAVLLASEADGADK